METTVFLGIEGVLSDYATVTSKNKNDVFARFNVNKDKLSLLYKLIQEINGKIVFISSLRLENDFSELVQAFMQKGFTIVGTTKQIDDNKSQEILDYLKTHEVPRYLILEDENLEEVPEIQEHFIQTPTDDGIQENHINDAINLVKQKRLIIKP